MKIIQLIKLLIVAILTVNIISCTTIFGEKAKEDALNLANKKAKNLGLKVGKACKYIGIGDNSGQTAIKNGKIKLKMFSVNVGGILKNCTYVYGK